MGVDDIEDDTTLKPTIRPFNSSDLNGVQSIERQCFTEPWSENMFEALYQINPSGFYVAVIDERIVGYVIVLMEQSFRHWSKKKTAHLMNIAVHPRYRDQGIGKRLIDKIISVIKEAGTKKIYLEVRASNTNAIAFYKKFGFYETGVIKGFYGDEDAIVMVKNMS